MPRMRPVGGQAMTTWAREHMHGLLAFAAILLAAVLGYW